MNKLIRDYLCCTFAIMLIFWGITAHAVWRRIGGSGLAALIVCAYLLRPVYKLAVHQGS